jgi:hypothetical protein
MGAAPVSVVEDGNVSERGTWRRKKKKEKEKKKETSRMGRNTDVKEGCGVF